MYLGVIADDFTGASDVANTLTKGGLSTVQLLGLPASDTGVGCDAAVVALKTRSIAAQDAVEQSLAALRWLRAQGCRQYLFKYCSTFDSTPDGNIGPVGEALAKALGVRGVPSCPAFPTTGRTVYHGHLFVGDRLLNESGMEHHPLAGGVTKRFSGVHGPGVILAGSCSKATLDQIDVHRRDHPALAIDIAAAMSGDLRPETLVSFATQHSGQAPLIYSSAVPGDVKKAQEKYGRGVVSGHLEHLFAETATQLVKKGFRRIVTAGGETSGAVVNALGIRALEIGPEIDPGVPALATVGELRLALALKSGNFGSPDFFMKALRILEAADA